jgi:hypothetical protein
MKIKNYLSILFVIIMSIGMLTSVYAIDVSINDYDPIPAEAGQAVNVWIKVQNNGFDEVENDVEIEIRPKDGLELSAGDKATKKVGVLGTGSSHIIKYRLLVKDDAFEGTHLIDVKIKSEKSTFNKELEIEVIEKDKKEIDLSIGNINSDPTRIKPDDDDVKLDVNILNLGDGIAQGVKVELVNLPDGITLSQSYSGSALVGNIESDSTNIATFYIDIDEAVLPKEHLANLKVSYKYKPFTNEDEYKYEQKLIPLKIAIKPIPLYEITNVEITPEILTAGDDDIKLKVTIKNVGEEKGESVRIKVYGKTEQPFTYERSSDFVAPSLEPDEEGQGTLLFKIDDKAALQKYFLDFEIKNIVNEDVITYNKKIPIIVTNPMPDNPWKLVNIGIGLIVLVILYLIFKAITGRKKNTKAKKLKGRSKKDFFDED